jgi:ABC-type dipeptide/oligopeptide/nickel transport system ATPase component
MALLEVRDLTVSFRTLDGIVRAVEGVSFSLDSGRTLGIVGESGSGKSVSALTIMGLTRLPNAAVSGQIVFDGRDLLALPDEQMRQVRGARIAMIFQDPLSSLHPLYRIGWQISRRSSPTRTSRGGTPTGAVSRRSAQSGSRVPWSVRSPIRTSSRAGCASAR